MRKKIKRLIMGVLAVVAAILLCVPIYARAAETKAGKIGYYMFFRYQIMNEGTENEEAYILGYTGKDTEITIPSDVKGIPVTTINNGAFKGWAKYTKITISEGVKTIGAEAFAYCSNLTEIDIPSTVETIQKSAFNSCKKLVSVKINTENCKLKTIGEKAFYLNEKLSDIEFPESLEEIGANAFNGCDGLNEIVLPKSLKSIADGAFMDCSGMTKVTISEGTKTIGENAFSENSLVEVNIPSTVEVIQESAFETCTNLETVNINTVDCKLTKIGESAFHDCGSLTNIDFPNSLKEIGKQAFNNCSSLEKIDLPDGLETIGDSAFTYCDGLVEVSIPLGVKNLGELLFNQSNNIKKVTIPAAMLDHNIITSKEVESITLLDDGTTTILDGHALTQKTKLTDIVFSDSITSIPTEFFSTCTAVKNVKLPKNLKKIGDYAFYYCEELASIEIPEGVTEIGESAFGQSGIEEITLPKLVEKIGNWSFAECSKLTSVKFAGDIRSIGDGAFANCPLLKEVDIPDSVGSIGKDIFEGSPEVEIDITKTYFKTSVSGIGNAEYTGKPIVYNGITVSVNGYILERNVDYTVTYENNVYVGTATVSIEGKGRYTGVITKTFKISGLMDISKTSTRIRITNFVSSARYTGKAVTQNLKTMKIYRQNMPLTAGKDYKVTYSNNVNAGKAKMVITGIGKYTGTITKYFTISIPKNASYTVGNVKYKIVNNATNGTGTVIFLGTTKSTNDKNFTSLSIKSSVKIGGITFKVTRIYAKALMNYKYLKSVAIGDGITTIDAYVFYGCKSLSNVTMGKGVTTIGGKTFYSCGKMTKLVVKSSNLKKLGQSVFAGAGTKPVVYVPKAKLTSYKKIMKNSGMTTKATYKTI